MRVVLTGTPGTGKSTLSEPVASELDLQPIHLNDVVREKDLVQGYDDGDAVMDIDAVRSEFSGMEDFLLEGHLAHHVPADIAVVLRCRPDVLYERLRNRFPEEKSRENAEAEALDIVLMEAMDLQETVFEVDTTDRDPLDVMEVVVDGVQERRSRAGVVDWSEFLEGLE